MKGADNRDVQPGSLLQDSLCLGTVFADDAEVVAAGLAGPAFRILDIVGTEFAEGVGREEHLIPAVVAHDNFRPVHHRGGDKGQRAGAQIEDIAFLDNHTAVGVIGAEELLHHHKGLGTGNDHGRRIELGEDGNAGGMIRFHVVDDQIVRRLISEDFADIGKPGFGAAGVDGIADSGFIVNDDIGIIGHAERDIVLPFKQVDFMVISADIKN